MSELKKLPKGWQWVKLGDICEFTYGSSLPANVRKGGKIPVYGSNGIVGYHDKSITKGQAIIIGRKGSIGEIHYSSNNCFPIDTTYYIDKSSLKKNLDFKFFYFLLKNLKLEELNKAAAIPGLNRNDAYALQLPFPPLPEQKRLATLLTEKLTDVERLQKTLEEQLQAINLMPSAILRQAFNGEL